MNQDKQNKQIIAIVGSSPSPSMKKVFEGLEPGKLYTIEDHTFVELTAFSGEGKSKIVLDTETDIVYNQTIEDMVKEMDKQQSFSIEGKDFKLYPNRAERRKAERRNKSR